MIQIGSQRHLSSGRSSFPHFDDPFLARNGIIEGTRSVTVKSSSVVTLLCRPVTARAGTSGDHPGC